MAISSLPAAAAELYSTENALNHSHHVRADHRFGDIETYGKGNMQYARKARPEKSAPAPESNAIRTTVPDGQHTLYQRTTFSYFPFWGIIYSGYDYGGAVDMVTTDDGKIYLHNPSSQNFLDVWIEATEKDGIFTIAPGQAVDYNELSEEYLYVCALEYVMADDGSQEGWYYSTDTGEFHLRKEGDRLVATDPDILLGICYYGEIDGQQGYEWSGYGDCQQNMTVFTGSPVQLPANAAVEDVRYGCIPRDSPAYFSEVATDGNDLYVKGICPYFPDVWVKGSVEGDKWSLPQYSYLGVYNGHLTYLTGGKVEEVFDESRNKYVEEISVDGAPEFYYDSQKGTMDNVKPIVFPTTDDISCYQLAASFKDLSIVRQSNEITNPSAVYDLIYNRLFDEDG